MNIREPDSLLSEQLSAGLFLHVGERIGRVALPCEPIGLRAELDRPWVLVVRRVDDSGSPTGEQGVHDLIDSPASG